MLVLTSVCHFKGFLLVTERFHVPVVMRDKFFKHLQISTFSKDASRNLLAFLLKFNVNVRRVVIVETSQTEVPFLMLIPVLLYDLQSFLDSQTVISKSFASVCH